MGRKQILGLFLRSMLLISVIGLVGLLVLLIPVPALGWTYEDLGRGSSVQQTSDNGYIIGGNNLVKIDAEGNLEWYKPIVGVSARQTPDGGYINGGDNVLTKTDSAGTVEWESILAASDELAIQLVRTTADGGYVVLGQTQSYGAGGYDIWLIKTDADGNTQWDKTFGGTADDRGSSVQQTIDGGYVIGGDTRSYGAGEADLWLIKTDADGNTQWDKTFGGPSWESGGCAQQTSDGGYVICGTTMSFAAIGDSDVWLIKTDENGNWQWDNVMGLFERPYCHGYYVEQTSDGGYIILGDYEGDSYDPDCLWKTDMNGYEQECMPLGPGIRAIQQTSDGGYVRCGEQWMTPNLLVVKMGPILGYPVNQPSNVSPSDGAEGVGLDPNLQSSAFSAPDAGDTHGASQWQITTTPGDYSSPVFDSGIDFSNLTSRYMYDFLLDYSTTYYWRVRHANQDGALSPWSSETSFTTCDNSPPNQPTNEIPPNGATGVSLTPMLMSSPPDDPDEGWDGIPSVSQWQVTTTAGDYSSPVFDSDTPAVPSGILDYSTTYYWRVRFCDRHGAWSEWSVETSFTTRASPVSVNTLPANDISSDAAILNGEITALGNSGFVALAAHASYSLGLASDGTLWGWGAGYGSSPTQVGSDTNWVAVAAGESHRLGVRSDGTLWAWGANYAGQLGLGDTDNRISPTQVGSDTNWVAVAAGTGHSLGLRSDGTLWAWGHNGYGQLGVNDTENRLIPTQVGSGTNWVTVATYVCHSLGVRSDGTLWAWGRNYEGQLGLGYTSPSVSVPVQVSSGTNWATVCAGEEHSIGMRSDGLLLRWGGGYGSSPTGVGGGTNWVAVAAGVYVADLALRSDGTLWALGSSPTQVGSAGNWVAVCSGYEHSLGLRSDGTLWAWGANDDGQLGLGDSDGRSTPTQVMFSLLPIQVSFEWGLTTAYGDETTPQTMTGIGAFSADINGLTAAATYHYRAKADGDGTAYGGDMTFTTVNNPPNQPTNTSPPSGATSISLTTSLQSNAFYDPDGHAHAASEWQIAATAGDYSSPILDSDTDGSNLTEFAVPAGILNGNTTYYWHVRYSDADGAWSEWSAETSFTTINRQPNQPANISPPNGAAGSILTPTLQSSSFSDPDGGDSHWGSQWQVTETAGDYSSPVFDSNTDASHLASIDVPSLSYSSTYYWRVRHLDGHGGWSDWSAETSFTTGTRPPNQPTGISPGSGAVEVSLTPTLQSSAFSDPDGGDTHAASQWQVTSVTGDYSSPVLDSGVDAGHLTQFEIASGLLDYSNMYYWRVRHQDNRGTWSEWSAEASFTTLNREPGQPTNTLPTNGATSASRTSVLQSSTFTDPDSGDTHIASRWQVTSTAGDYSAPVFDSGVDAGHLTSFGIPSGLLQYSTTYYWHVRYEDNHGTWSPWSAETSFSTSSQPQAEFSVTSVKVSKGVMLIFFSNLSSGGATPLTYAWDFDNDGTVDATEREPWHRYDTPGTYTVTLTVTDAWGETDTQIKPNCLTIVGPKGAKAETADGQVSTDFPSGAVSGTAVVTIKGTATSPLPDGPKGFQIGNTSFVMMALGEDGNEIVTLSQPSVITVKYSEADLAAAGGDPNRLVLAYWDERASQWKPLKTSLNTAEMTLSASTTHLSTWAVMGKTTSASDGLPWWSWVLIGLGAVGVMGASGYLASTRLAKRQ